jgi:hypothetical protein
MTELSSLESGRPRTPAARRTPKPGDYGSTPAAAELRRQMRRLAELEATPLYRELCAAANATRAASPATYGNGKAVRS